MVQINVVFSEIQIEAGVEQHHGFVTEIILIWESTFEHEHHSEEIEYLNRFDIFLESLFRYYTSRIFV